ncbi:MAG: response regulator [Rhizobiales bacterium]|nr:response regulator [Hyphomicrobiales bacterium]
MSVFGMRNASAARQRGGAGITRADGMRPRILYAEDSTASRVVTTALLRRMGCEVDAVEDGEEAFHRAEAAPYDIILLDIEMPVMDGVTAARSIRALGGKSAETPILALSAFLADSTEFSHWRDAFDQALPKPANGNELRAAIEAALANDAAPAPETKDVCEAVAALGSLRKGLTRGSWFQLMAAAAGEMTHFASAAAAAFEAGSRNGAKDAAHALKGLARSFAQARLETAAQAFEETPTTANLALLAAAAAAAAIHIKQWDPADG